MQEHKGGSRVVCATCLKRIGQALWFQFERKKNGNLRFLDVAKNVAPDGPRHSQSDTGQPCTRPLRISTSMVSEVPIVCLPSFQLRCHPVKQESLGIICMRRIVHAASLLKGMQQERCDGLACVRRSYYHAMLPGRAKMAGSCNISRPMM